PHTYKPAATTTKAVITGANCHRVTTSAKLKGGRASSPMPPRLLAGGQARRSASRGGQQRTERRAWAISHGRPLQALAGALPPPGAVCGSGRGTFTGTHSLSLSDSARC